MRFLMFLMRGVMADDPLRLCDRLALLVNGRKELLSVAPEAAA